jgi:hypothetical protein
MKRKFDPYVKKCPKLNSRPVYCSRLYGKLPLKIIKLHFKRWPTSEIKGNVIAVKFGILATVVVGRICPSNLNDDFQVCPKFFKQKW